MSRFLDAALVQVRLHQLQEEGEVIAPDVAVEQNPAFPVHNAHVCFECRSIPQLNFVLVV